MAITSTGPNDPGRRARTELLVLGLEVLFVLGLATVAGSQPGWGAPAVLLLLLLWAAFLFAHSRDVGGALSFLGAG